MRQAPLIEHQPIHAMMIGNTVRDLAHIARRSPCATSW